jgi:hypothetical protein
MEMLLGFTEPILPAAVLASLNDYSNSNYTGVGILTGLALLGAYLILGRALGLRAVRIPEKQLR